MIVENNLLGISNVLFRDKKNWKYITDEQKMEYFFIINRYMSKKYPKEAQLLNLKSINKVSAFDSWYYFMIDKPYPNWFWSKSDKKSDKPEISKKEFNTLLVKLKINKIEDLEYLIESQPEFIKEELKWIKDLEKRNK